jgi:hypothetical protein
VDVEDAIPPPILLLVMVGDIINKIVHLTNYQRGRGRGGRPSHFQFKTFLLGMSKTWSWSSHV